MKIASLAIAAIGTIALITTSTAMASDPTAALTHADLAHRNADRQQTYQTARSLGLSHTQTDRLKSSLQHQSRDDQRAHESATRLAPAIWPSSPGYGFSGSAQRTRAQQFRARSLRRNSYSNRSFGATSPRHRNRGWNNGYSQRGSNNHGLNFSTPGFSFRVGH